MQKGCQPLLAGIPVINTLVLLPGGQAAPDMSLGLVGFQNLPHLRKQGGIILGQALDDVFVNGGFGDPKVPGSGPDCGAGFNDVHSQFAGSFLDGV